MRCAGLIPLLLTFGATIALAAEPSEDAAKIVAASHMKKGQELMEHSRLKEAEHELDLAITSYSKGAAIYGLRGKVRYLRKNYPGAVEDFDQYLIANPRDPDLTFLRGLSKSLLKPEDVVGACADFLIVRDRAKQLNMDKYCKGQEGWAE